MIRLYNILLGLIIIAVLGVSCKKVTLDCNYIVSPYIQHLDTDDVNGVLNGVVAYAFYADTAQWTVSSYANALKGVISSRTGGRTQSYDMVETQNEQGKIEFKLLNMPVILIVCDPITRIYGWRHAEIDYNLSQVQVPVRFKPWKTQSEYNELRWNMVNEFLPDPPIVPEEPVDPEPPTELTE